MAWRVSVFMAPKRIYYTLILEIATATAAIAGGISTIPSAVNLFSRQQSANFHHHLNNTPDRLDYSPNKFPIALIDC